MHTTPEVLLLPTEFRSLKPQVFFVSNVGSDTHPNYRLQVRQLFSECLRTHRHLVPEQMNDLSFRPRHDNLSLSVSHSLNASAFGWCDKPSQIGVDIEVIERLSAQVLKRVCSREELEACPYVPHLWTAKEAVFKSLQTENNVISNVEILDWRPKKETEWFFTAKWRDREEHIKGIGFSCLKMDHSLSFFVHRP
ncbi:MAG: 4'-phosphopantetheinyl transferase superfamily protein [Bdellovibrionales bacterium]|nr:4'-phosphopantetheinyl transferase superfamily protein [Bdellovibrionales bacterium]